jgi:hypothetical protein
MGLEYERAERGRAWVDREDVGLDRWNRGEVGTAAAAKARRSRDPVATAEDATEVSDRPR